MAFLAVANAKIINDWSTVKGYDGSHALRSREIIRYWNANFYENVSESSYVELKKLTEQCTANIIFVTAFLDRKTFRQFAPDIAWETEAWIAEAPDHVIHFNGEKFLGPYSPSQS